MRKAILSFLFSAFVVLAGAQQALWNGSEIISPEIHPDETVTFRLFAPGAREVKVNGDFAGAPAEMVRDEAGLWSYTTPGPLPPELYSYSFDVDGLRVLDPSNVYTVRDVSSLFNIFLIDSSPDDLYGVKDVPHGSVSRVWYDSPTLGKHRRLSVYTPPGYEESDREYPVLYLLHGSGGDEEAWLALGRTAQILDNLTARGEAEPMIVVMTNGNPTQQAAPGESSEGLVKPTFGVSGMNKGQFETAFPDIVNFVDSHYRTRADKSGRAIAGLSMGGFHSLHISKQFPDLFDYVGLFSAAIFPWEDSHSEVYEDMEGKLKRQFEKNPRLYWIAIGSDDFLYEDNIRFRKMLDSMGLPYEYFESPDGHIWKNWRIYLSKFAPLLFRNI